jgi:hypothetical protein
MPEKGLLAVNCFLISASTGMKGAAHSILSFPESIEAPWGQDLPSPVPFHINEHREGHKLPPASARGRKLQTSGRQT